MGNNAEQRPPARRARSPAKRAAMLSAARELFFDRGIEGTTIEDIAAKAGVSKVTVYGHFGDKETLLEAVVSAQAAEMEQALLGPRAKGKPLPEVLASFGIALMRFLTSPEIERCERLLAAEAPRHPELARRFYDAGPGRLRARVAQILAETGQFADPHQAAEDLIALWLGMWPTRQRLGVALAPGADDLGARVQRGTALFLRAYGLTLRG